MVIQHHGVAVVGGLALAAETGPQRVAQSRAIERCTCLVPNLEAHVNPLHIVIGPYVAIGIRRAHAEACIVDAIPVLNRPRHSICTVSILIPRVYTAEATHFLVARQYLCLLKTREHRV